MRIAIDAMGGDRAPEVEVQGVREALSLPLIKEIILVGDRELIEKALATSKDRPLAISIVHASEKIEMGESPAAACRQKKDSSIMVAMQLLKEKRADALVSAGNTGAIMTAALLLLGRLEGVNRPAIVTFIPSVTGKTILLDVGANVDCKPEHLLQFAMMGSVYAEYVLQCPNPRVGLLSIGEEKSKGNRLTFQAYNLLRKSRLNFVGNVEGRDIINGKVDVVVCDGFVGNIVLKFAEGLVELIFNSLKSKFQRGSVVGKLREHLTRPLLEKFQRTLDYAEYGGAPLLGVNGVCIVSHGGSSVRAIKNAIKTAGEFASQKVNAHIMERLQTVQLFSGEN